MSTGRIKFVWFVIGCLVGGIGTSAALVFYFLPRFASEAKSDPQASEPTEVTSAPAPEGRSPVCPGLTPVDPPWLPPDVQPKDREEGLPFPPSLKRRVAFWKTIWGKQPNRLYVLVDRRRPWVVHDRVDCRDIFADGKIATRGDERTCDRRLIAKKRNVVKRLRKQRRRPRKALLKLYDRKRKLAKTAYRNVMVIDGRYNFFTKAIEHASLYMADVEKVFQGMGLLPELARVSIIESLADPQAVSPAGAVGAYQFVAGTARQYLMVKNGVDERLDPVRGGWAAAHYLRDLHKEFKSWPLALTAYNTGPTRLRKLIKRRRTRDIGRLADRGTLGGFGFDGQNYYAQLVAVVELTSATPSPSDNGHRRVFRVDEPMPLSKMASCLETSAEDLRKANPALGENIVSKGAHVPKDYLLAVPDAVPRVETASQP